MEHSRNVSKYTYEQIIDVIKRAAARVSMVASRGRTGSANDEREYLQKLSTEIHKIEPHSRSEQPSVEHAFRIDIPESDRFWYDIRIEYIAINVKITNARQADNAFNKQGIVCSITGRTQHPQKYTWRELAFALQRDKWLTARERMSEYHYLVIRKTTGQMMCLRSILDIARYIPNPCNVLQINWGHEAARESYVTPDAQIAQKRYELVSIIQQALRAEIANLEQFALVNFAQEVAAAPAAVPAPAREDDTETETEDET